MRRTLSIVLIATAGIALVGCSSGSSSTPTAAGTASTGAGTPTTVQVTTTVSTTAVGQKVLAILTAGEAAIEHAKTLSGNASYTAASNAFDTGAQQLQALDYPPAARADAKAEVAILEKLSVDAQQAITDPSESVVQNVENDEGTEKADSDALRHDLGLPPAAASTG